MKEIVFFGDSLTAGYGLKNPAKESMPALIEEKILQLGLNLRVVNAGISGDTTRSALARIHRSLKGEIGIFVLELGANDFLRSYDVGEVRMNLQMMINQVQKAYPQASILLLGIELPVWAHSANSAGYTNVFASLAKENDIELVPSFLKGVAGIRSLNMFDGVHPLASGYVVAADNIWPSLLKLIENLKS
ncbi:arylesterase [Pedobacter paludis]|uniref:Arylesterase n=1 Tax=Pedobacter paludis TaxID=2203212 RepID=A0A317ETB9_9SPHI|nr:arylesterase [Pedobacter paludis]PWS29675.1 arylesterase [Pedobacter paludis]